MKRIAVLDVPDGDSCRDGKGHCSHLSKEWTICRISKKGLNSPFGCPEKSQECKDSEIVDVPEKYEEVFQNKIKALLA